MRSLRLMGEEVIPAVREMGKELELFSPLVDPATGKPLTAEGSSASRGQLYDLIAACLFPLPAGGFSHRVRGFVLSHVPHPKPHKEE